MESKAPTSEIGQPSNLGYSVIPWGQMIQGDDLEHVPELTWPTSNVTYHRMRSDAQIWGLLQGTTLPIRRMRWVLDPNGARPEIVDKLQADLGLDIKGQDPRPRPRHKRRFVHDYHLRHALLMLVYGHMFFEQVGEIGDDGLWHLRKLAERMPQSIAEINVERDGGLRSIKQAIGMVAPEIPVDRLVAYVSDKEGANWTGRSILRPCYRNWIVKDRILRVGAINIERAGGVPVVSAPPDATPADMATLDAFARKFKVGEGGGGAIPNGAKLELATAQRLGDGAVDYIHLQNEEMARSFLMMFMQLGQTETGSRSLGSEFIDFFSEARGTIAKAYATTFSEYVIEDWVDWNYGEDEEQVPLLVNETDEDPVFAAMDLVALINAGAIVVDQELEESIRERLALPDKGTSSPPPPGPVQKQLPPGDTPAPPDAAVAGRRQRSSVAGAQTSPVPLPSRPLRRQPYSHEIAASVDYQQMDSQWNGGRDLLVAEIRAAQSRQIQELHDLIVDADGNVDKLASILAKPIHKDTIASRMVAMAHVGVQQAVDEANRQGKTISHPDMADVELGMQKVAAAVDQLLARAISESAARRATRLTGGSLAPAEVAANVADHLRTLSDTYLKDELGGAMTQAMNTGRAAAIRAGGATRIYASELLDTNTCSPCAGIDGTEWANIYDAEAFYPSGGYADCAGGGRCRGTLVAVYGEGDVSDVG